MTETQVPAENKGAPEIQLPLENWPKLRNGATVIASRPARWGDGRIVLALTTGWDPYATWFVRNDNGTAHEGNYFDDIAEAVADYEERR